jgi:PAS domain S-box-containing protein
MTGWRGALTSIRGKLIVLGALGFLAVLLVSLAQVVATDRMLDGVQSQEITRRVSRARRALELRQQQKAAIISEFAVWDDAYRFADHPQGPGAARFIQENYIGWLPARYNDRVIRIWNRRHESLLSWADSSVAGVDRSIPSEAVIAATERSKTSGGFLMTPRGLFLVGTSVILPSSDQTLSGVSHGYVMAAQPVDRVMEQEIGKDLQLHFSLIPSTRWESADSILSITTAGGDSMVTRFPIRGITGEMVAVVQLVDSRQEMAGLLAFGRFILAATLIGGLLTMTVLWIAVQRIVSRPMARISSALETMQQDSEMRPLEGVHPATEWRLFAQSFNKTVQALKNSEERYQVLFERAVDAYVLLDSASQTILEANPAAQAMSGCGELDMVGQPFATVMDLVPEAVEAGAFLLRRPDGTVRTVGLVSTFIQLAGLKRTLVSLRDLSQYERLQTQVRQAQKMEAIGALAGGVAHDFNNLVGAILVSSSVLRGDLMGQAEATESLDTIDRAARRASDLTRRLLRLARREQPRSIPLALNEVVTNVVDLCRRTFNPAVQIETHLDATLPSMVGDASQLEQSVLNICINARDAMPDGGTLRLSTRVRMVHAGEISREQTVEPGPHISLMIEDSGPGLSAEAEKHMFEPFFTTKERGKGTGLGLPTAYGTVRTHGGTIRVYNRPGQGVTFELLFPPSNAVIPVAQTGAVTLPAGGRERILVIDDEAALRSAMSRSLTRLGYSVVMAEGGAAGVMALESATEKFDLVLLDVIMPVMNGVETFRKLRALQSDLPVLVCSGYAAEGERQQLMNLGAEGFLPKPFDTAELATAVREVLERSTV